MDSLTALAAIKTGAAAGKQLHNLSKEIAGFFDATDGAKKAHAKKKNSIIATANEEAMATWTQAQNAKTAEAELREFIVNTKGLSAYQELLKIRREVIAQRKETERQAQIEAEERTELIITIFAVLLLLVSAVSGAGVWMYYMGWIDL
jgi:heme/copper-type cytochrome/quinol oxidase subunit 2